MRATSAGSDSRVIAVIPARFASTRLPGKPLALIQNKPMIQWVYEACLRARSLAATIVATDDERIVQVVRGFGGNVELTDPALASGTDRMAAVADRDSAEIYVNVQGDEPLMDPRAIDEAVLLVRERGFGLSTIMTPFAPGLELEELNDPGVVKVLADRNQRAIYFSRYPIPYSRVAPEQYAELSAQPQCRRHVGIYAYRRETLHQFRSLPPSLWEKAESLEQLRALEHGIPIGISEVNFLSIGVDTPQDLVRVEEWLKREKRS